MTKNIIIKSSIAFISLLVLSFCSIWFFQNYQIKKQINSVAIDNEKISFGKISTSGFPTSKQITIENLTYTSSPETKLIVKKLTAETKVFSDTFFIKDIGQIITEDAKNESLYITEFKPDTKITISSVNNKISKIDIITSGYKLLDKDGKEIMTFEMQDSKSSLLIADMYQYQYSDFGSKATDKNGNIIFNAASTFVSLKWSNDKDNKYTVELDSKIKDLEYNNISSLYNSISKTIIPEEQQAIEDEQSEQATRMESEKATNKNNFEISTKFTLSKNSDKIIDLLPEDQMAQLPDEMKGQFQKKATPYSLSLVLNKLEFFNALYKISLEGSLNTYEDDILPSGEISLKIESFDNLAISINALIKEVMENAKERQLSLSPEEHSINNLTAEEIAQSTIDKKVIAGESLERHSVEDAKPTIFDKYIFSIKELARKNSSTQENVLVLDIKREKGLNFLINEIPLMEVMMGFVQNSQNADGLKNTKTSK